MKNKINYINRQRVASLIGCGIILTTLTIPTFNETKNNQVDVAEHASDVINEDKFKNSSVNNELDNGVAENELCEVINLYPSEWFVARSLNIEDELEYERMTGTDRICFYAEDAYTMDSISGLRFVVVDSKNNIIDEFTTDDKYHIINRLVVGETYTIRQMNEIEDYEKAIYTFTMPETNYSIEDYNDYYFGHRLFLYLSKASDRKRAEEIEANKFYHGSISIAAIDVIENTYIPGVSFEFYDSDYNLVDSWVSDDFYHEVVNLKDGMYKVKIADLVSGYNYDWKDNFYYMEYIFEYDVQIRDGKYIDADDKTTDHYRADLPVYFTKARQYSVSNNNPKTRVLTNINI